MRMIFGALLAVAFVTSAMAEPDEITRRIGYEMLAKKMSEQLLQEKLSEPMPPVHVQAPGYFLIGRDVRIG